MKSKTQIIKYIQEQISNLRCAMIDNDLDKMIPEDARNKVVEGYKKRIDDLRSICKQLDDLLL